MVKRSRSSGGRAAGADPKDALSFFLMELAAEGFGEGAGEISGDPSMSWVPVATAAAQRIFGGKVVIALQLP